MEQSGPTCRSVHFGVFDLDLTTGELRKSGLKIRLPQQSFRILARLVEHPGDVASRDELRRILWPDDTFVDFEVGLTSAVKKLRDALGDSAESPRFVETLPRLGYRFIAPVRGTAESVEGAPPADALPVDAEMPTWRSAIAGHVIRWRALVVVLAAVAVVGLASTIPAAVSSTWRRLRAPTPSPIQSIAVLPLQNLTGDPAQEYFADGLTEELATCLAEMADGTDLRVISRTSTVAYKGTRKPPPVIGRELNVDGVIEGTIVRSNGRVRLSARLVDARSSRQVWDHSYESAANDLIALQRDVAGAIAEFVAGRVTPRRHPLVTHAVSAEANELFFKATYSAGRNDFDGFKQAISYADAAIVKQPDFASAYARAAVWYNQFAFVGGLSPLEFMPKAEAAARKAIELDEEIPEAHAALGLVLYRFHWDWSGAERELRRSLELNHRSADSHRMLAVFLSAIGNSKEAVDEAQLASYLDPLSPQALLNLGIVHREAGQNDLAVSEFQKVLEKRPDFSQAHLQLGVSYLTRRDWNAAIKELETAAALSRHNPRFLAWLGYADAISGETTEARTILATLEDLSRQQFIPPVDIAGIQIGLGQREAALASLERACQVRDRQLTTLRMDRRMDALRSDSRFQDLLRRVGPVR